MLEGVVVAEGRAVAREPPAEDGDCPAHWTGPAYALLRKPIRPYTSGTAKKGSSRSLRRKSHFPGEASLGKRRGVPGDDASRRAVGIAERQGEKREARRLELGKPIEAAEILGDERAAAEQDAMRVVNAVDG